MRLARALLYASLALGASLALVWPFAVGRDGDDPAFRFAALAGTLAFFSSLAACCVARLREARR